MPAEAAPLSSAGQNDPSALRGSAAAGGPAWPHPAEGPVKRRMPGPLNGTLSSPSSQAVLPGRRSLSMWQIRPLGSNKAHWLSLHTHPAPHPPAPRASVLGDIWKPLRGSAVPEPGLHSQAASWGSQLTGIHSRVRAREAVPVAARGHLLCLGNCLGSLASHPPHLAPYPHVHLEAGTPSPASLEPCGVAASLRCTVTVAASRPPRPGPRRPHGGGASFHPPAAAVVQRVLCSTARTSYRLHACVQRSK